MTINYVNVGFNSDNWVPPMENIQFIICGAELRLSLGVKTIKLDLLALNMTS